MEKVDYDARLHAVYAAGRLAPTDPLVPVLLHRLARGARRNDRPPLVARRRSFAAR
jgi:hypothetical protein